jgi:hypothetical protein
MIVALSICAVIIYSLPRTATYAMNLFRKKSYDRMFIYYRTRLYTLLALFLLHFGCYIFLVAKSNDLIIPYDALSPMLVVILASTFFLTWLIVDIYWTIAIKTYTENKQSKEQKALDEAERNSIDANAFLNKLDA